MRIAVVGNGKIGHGIAEIFAVAGHDVALIGRNNESLNAAVQKIQESIAGHISDGVLPTLDIESVLSRVSPSTELSSGANAQLVFEALPEDLSLKRSTFLQLEQLCSETAILATASGHPASLLESGIEHPERLIATHFWFPPQLIPLVEVCGTPSTSREVIDTTCDVLRSVGKEPVIIDREIEGFIGNRIQFAALREAWSLWASGVASAETIDKVVKMTLGRRYSVTGPIESGDVGGLATMASFASALWPDLANDTAVPHRVLERASSEGGTVSEITQAKRDRLLADRRSELVRWLLRDQSRQGSEHQGVQE